MKKVGVLFLMVLLLSNLVACSGGTYVISIGEVESTNNSIIGEYDSFSGEYFKKVNIANGESYTITFSVRTEKGELIAKVINSDGETLKTLKDGDSFTLNHSGSYKLQVEGEKHRGNFTLSWE
ncbi:hypothetical protein ABE096_23680 [Robertmurraya massiliosenegalensis]|uniref:hypothetical protein n=1 Tax=Robertmurraya TaxID=2837507 RepID=UPI0039A62C1C